jgi:hypothetical protein
MQNKVTEWYGYTQFFSLRQSTKCRRSGGFGNLPCLAMLVE